MVEGSQDAIHPNLRGALLSIAIQHGGEVEFNHVIELYRKSPLQEQKVSALSALCGVHQPELISRVLEFAFTDEVRPQDAPYVFSNLSANIKARQIVWTFFQEKWKLIHEKFSGGSFLLGRIASSVCGCHTTDEMAAKVEAFIASLPKADISSIDKEILQSVEKVRANAKWVKTEAEHTAKWLKDEGY